MAGVLKRIFMAERLTGRAGLDVFSAVLFWSCKFEHEGMERGIDGFSDGLFGGGFEAVLESFKMGLDIS